MVKNQPGTSEPVTTTYNCHDAM